MDDLIEMVTLIQFLFARERPQWILQTAYDGIEGLERLKEFRPRVIVVNYLMPKMDGMRMCRRIRDENLAPGAWIIFNSACGRATVKWAAKEAGANEFLSVPYDPKVLIEMIERRR